MNLKNLPIDKLESALAAYCHDLVHPELVADPFLELWPDEIYAAYTEQFADEQGLDICEAQKAVDQEFPKLAKLCDILDANEKSFIEACRTVGTTNETTYLEAESIINLIILIAERNATKERIEEAGNVAAK